MSKDNHNLDDCCYGEAKIFKKNGYSEERKSKDFYEENSFNNLNSFDVDSTFKDFDYSQSFRDVKDNLIKWALGEIWIQNHNSRNDNRKKFYCQNG